MIQIDIGTAIILYSAVLLAMVATLWTYTEFFVHRPQRQLGNQFLWRCVFCRYTYLDEHAASVSQCPRCHSYNDAAEGAEAPVPAASQKEDGPPPEISPGTGRSSRQRRHHQKRRGPRRHR